MAIVLNPAGGSAASGSIGGVVHSHNRSGAYIRAKVIPTNPNTASQAAVRVRFGSLVAAWKNATAEERSTWDAYAATIVRKNALGASFVPTGREMFIGDNSTRMQMGLAMILNNMAIGGDLLSVGQSYVMTNAGPTATTHLMVDMNTSHTWYMVGGALGYYLSTPRPSTVNFFKGPYSYAGKILGADTPPLAASNVITLPFALNVGERVFYKLIATSENGRCSASLEGSFLKPPVV
jgi:hypothetical protein